MVNWYDIIKLGLMGEKSVDINKKSLSKGDLLKYCLVFFITFSIVIITARYATEEEFRRMIDKDV